MTKNAVFAWGVVVLLVIAGLIYYASQTMSPSTTATSTPLTTTGDTGQTTPSPVQTEVPSAPLAVTDAHVAPSDTTAVMNGSVTPNGAFTNYWFEYGTTVSFGGKTSAQSIGSGFAAIPAPGYITGLVKDTTYYFRLVAENGNGKVAGAQYAFHTTIGTPPPVGTAPTTRTLAATGVARTAANLNGEVTPNKAPTRVWFEYGKTPNLGSTSALQSVGDGSTKVPTSISLNALDAATTYYFRLDAQNQFGTVNGAILNFKTTGPAAATAPTVTTRSATTIGTSTVTLRGTLNPNGAETAYWFEYSTDARLGTALLRSTPQQSAGAGTNAVQVNADVSALTLGTNYYVRLVAQNSQGTVRGERITFRTR